MSDAETVLDEFTVSSEPGNERPVMERVAEVVGNRITPDRLEKLKSAVAEAVMNAIEHGNQNRPELPVAIQVVASNAAVRVRVTDHGGGREIPEAETPDLEAKLAGLQSPRGWGLFLIKSMVDEMDVVSDEKHHTIELAMYLKGDGDGS